jgi:hypothetical protein
MPPFGFESHRFNIEISDREQGYQAPRNGLPELDFWIDNEEANDMSDLTNLSALPLMEILGTSDHSMHCSGYPQYPQTVSMSNPALSRSIFDVQDVVDAASTLPIHSHGLAWAILASSPPQTIAPSAAFQPMLMSSPVAKHEPSTPIRMSSHSSVMFGSSPMGLMSPPVVPSQNDVEEAKYELADHDPVMSEFARHRTGVDRLHRRGYERKRHVGPSSRPRAAASRSGMLCDVVIAQNEFACGYPGCIDKQTGKQKRFKRQEHKKRHEKTVHEKTKHGVHQCWVPGCKTAPFTRTDNLKSHLKNTHGKNSANQRNKYVATLDKRSEYYDPDWVGDLTDAGYPILSKEGTPV